VPLQDWQSATEDTAARVWFADKPYTPITRFALHHSLLLQYSNNIVFSLIGRHTPVPASGTSRGFVANNTINPDVADFARNTSYPSYTVRNGGANALEDLIDWSEAHNVLIVLFTAPEHEGLLLGSSGEIYAEFLADMQRFADSSPYALFLDLQAEDRLTDLDYYDVIHVNLNGAEKWSHRLAEAMIAGEVLQRGGVGIVNVHGDNDLSVFHRQATDILEFFVVTDGVGSLVQQLDADQWKRMQEGNYLEFSDESHQFTLEKREDEFFWIYMYDSDGNLVTDAPFAIEELVQ